MRTILLWRKHVAIVGIGESSLATMPSTDGIELSRRVLARAIEDYGIGKGEIDGAMTTGSFEVL